MDEGREKKHEMKEKRMRKGGKGNTWSQFVSIIFQMCFQPQCYKLNSDMQVQQIAIVLNIVKKRKNH